MCLNGGGRFWPNRRTVWIRTLKTEYHGVVRNEHIDAIVPISIYGRSPELDLAGSPAPTYGRWASIDQETRFLISNDESSSMLQSKWGTLAEAQPQIKTGRLVCW